jgi:predicted nucleic acid-binding OB-fold protein
MSNINEEWFNLEQSTEQFEQNKLTEIEQKVELTNKKKIEALNALVNQQAGQIALLSDEIKQLKKEIYSSPFYNQSATQTTRTHELLEELKVIKQRELNIMLREKIPVPFTSFTSLSYLPGLVAKSVNTK